MTVGFVAFHYPGPEHFEEFVGRVRTACEFVRTRPACLTAECWVTADGEAVVTTGRFESAEALKAAFAAARDSGVITERDEREHRPREFFTLLSR
ncbi:antibiotic biosynthesis monooxygenase [Streptantibioticus cattleyicolor]|uniref:ABM domain-containing protein n=1 Tax=Streptantibioticus cattleyicolor (strain ATCC 35852 / DSM 46488 / JCM 4925 / NBRC 14057 / NRRL 8057) TaxID=1003195 RepID=F8JJI2_STREN|nr:antibiotic biosynthesis monooxygenase [Streptantibioticus cattleyicolor]AEW98691.1 hypothetical protein SCATT_p04980 [Streptantibioticus cattleyicolor NRRL 8057 = DSM 46488]CCB72252.1 protein of unknown function [Streptantibioticus cattleyicolor NRRL 8057 = DSM 46488]